MRRWLIWLPLGVITVVTGLLGLRFGWIAATITETDVIEAYARGYISAMQAEHPNEEFQPTDCVARPSDDLGIWLVVSCGRNACDLTRYREYHVSPLGFFVHGGDPGCPDASRRGKFT
jgi:hypothetical protein